jgi:teichuronic acid biosynthesis glycosyltransferase TuaC
VSDFGVSPTRVAVIRNGYDPAVFFSQSVTGVQSAVENSLRFLFVGWMLQSKGIFDIIEAAELMQRRNPGAFAKCEWWFVGQGEDGPRFADLVVRSPAANSVHLLGELPHSEVGQVMRRSSCLVLPSWSEGFPTVLPEALACGIPIIASDVGGIAEIVTPDNGILVPPRNPVALSQAFEAVLVRAWDHGRIVEQSRQYTWASSAKLVLQVYCDVLKGI